ncbi:MAG: hypothetical protein ACLTQL_07210 [Eisenbergiella sp.]|nr:hypothetical protein [Bacillota bacterium]
MTDELKAFTLIRSAFGDAYILMQKNIVSLFYRGNPERQMGVSWPEEAT